MSARAGKKRRPAAPQGGAAGPEFTGERVIPGEVDADLWQEHLSRYALAARLAPGRRVLDAGCGSGYGTARLAQAAREVVGLDNSAEALAYCRQHFSAPNVTFTEGDCAALPFPDGDFDLVVAFEVIEHLADAEAFLKEARRVLRPRGLLLLSTPNRRFYTEERGYRNPYHVREFDAAELEAALARHFPHRRLLAQNHVEAVAFTELGRGGALECAAEVAAWKAQDEPHFLLALGSPGPLPDRREFVFLGQGGNVLRERETHIRKVEADLAQLKEQTDRELAERRRWADQLQAEIEEKAGFTRRLQQEFAERTEWVKELEARVAERDARLAERQQMVEKLEQELASRAEWARQMEAGFEERTRWALKLEGDVAERDALLRERQQEVEKLEAEIAQRTRWARKMEADFEERARWALKLDADVAERDARLLERQQAVEKLEAELAARTAWAEGLDRELQQKGQELLQALEQRTDWVMKLDAQLAERTAWVQQLSAEVNALRADLQVLMNSAWYRAGRRLRLTPPPASGGRSEASPPRGESEAPEKEPTP